MQINGRSVAMAQAQLIATALVDTVANAEVCGGCKTQAKLTANKTAEAILSAVAIAEIAIDDGTVSGNKTIFIEQFSETVVEGCATVAGEVRCPR